MQKIDFYIKHLVRHQAKDIVLSSGKPVLFGFPSGSRASNNALDHGQLQAIVRESAPNEALQVLLKDGTTNYPYAGDIPVAVTVETRGPSDWKVRIAPAGQAPTQEAGQPGALGPKGAKAPTRGALPDSGPKPAARPAPAAIPVGPAPSSGQAGRPPTAPKERKSVPAPKVQLKEGEPQVNLYLREMVRLGASDLHLSSTVAPMVRLDGEMVALEGEAPLTPEKMEALLMEIAPERNQEEFNETNDSDFAHPIEGLARFRANYFRDRMGMGAVFRQIPFEILNVSKLGLPQGVLDLCWLSKGLVLVTGPTGSGKSTTLASLIDYINDNRTDHIITIEDPIEFVHGNKKCLINQREIGIHTKSFKSALRAALREDPDIVLVGEMRDLETIAIAIETAETGHLVFGTLHTTSAKSTVDRIIDQFPADQQEQIRVMLSESLRGVIAQVLCKKVGGGRAAGYEVLLANSAVANLIREGKTFQLTSVMQMGRNQGMQTMNDHLLEHVKEGRVEPEEAYIKSNDKQTMKEALKRMNITLKL